MAIAFGMAAPSAKVSETARPSTPDRPRAAVRPTTASSWALRALDARAFTAGTHVVLGGRDDGGQTDSVMAHELAHVVQQGAAAGRVAAMAPEMGNEAGTADRTRSAPDRKR